jgi:ABC-type transport system involved in multi-copper enzyme maturation permease subunit
MSLESIKTNKKNITHVVILLIFFSVILYVLIIEYGAFVTSAFNSKNILGLILAILTDIIIIIVVFLILSIIFYAIKGKDNESEYE